MTRGERNFNPGNIRKSPVTWLGKVTPSSDPNFEVFENAEYGIRALAKIICNYHRLYGLQTVSQIITRWAPSIENNTGAYIDDVANRLNVGANDALNLLSATVLAQLVSAIIHHENGDNIYDGTLILDACQAAIDSLKPPLAS